MKPRPFDYVRPDTVEEAVAILAEHGDDARILAGGQTLSGDAQSAGGRTRDPGGYHPHSRARGDPGDRWADGGGKIEVGAAVTQNRLMAWPALAQKLPLLAAALPFVGHFQTRNKGTVCGSIAHADPTSEIPLSLALLEGEVVLRSSRGTRVLAADDFQQGMLATAREPDELITAVRFPVMSGGVGFREVARRHGDFAIVAVAAVVENAGSVRVGVAGMADRPAVRRIAANSGSGIRDAIERLAWELEGYEDLHASARMRRDLLRGIAPVVIEEAKQCAA